MATKTLLSEEEYLAMSFGDWAPEYADGVLVERAWPNNSHSKTQHKLCVAFGRLGERLPVYTCPELTRPVAPRKYHIADLVVYAHEEPVEELPTQVPLVVVEIVSPDDNYAELMKKLEEYRAWGVPHVWLADPALRRICVYRDGGLVPVAVLDLPEFGVRIPVEEILG